MKKTQTHNAKSTIKRLLSYIRKGYKLNFFFVLVFIIISAVASVMGSLFIQSLIDDYIVPILGSSHPVFTGLLHAITIMAGIYLIGVIATLLFNWLMVKIGQGVQKNIRDEMFSNMQKLPIKFFDTNSVGDIMSHYTNDIDTLRQMISQSIPQLFSAIITIVAVFIAMLTVSRPLTFVVVVAVICIVFVVSKVSKKSSSYFVKQQESLGKVNGYIEEMMSGQKVIKVFSHEDETKKGFDKVNDELFDVASVANKYANTLMPIVVNLGNLQYVLIAIVGGTLAISHLGMLTIGAIAAFLQLSRAFSNPINQISQQLNFVIMALAGAERIFELIDEKPETDKGYVQLVNAVWENGQLMECEKRTGIWAWKHPHHDGTLTYTELKGNIVFDHVDFGYTEEKQVLHDISVYAYPGQKIAFVGATGAGKTTITNLINRFYDVQDGKIRYDEININKIKKADLRRSLGIVLQDTSLFTGTVYENIRYGKLDATNEEIVAAAKLTNAHEFIMKLADGYDTVISGTANDLSQGQRQLLSIARAALANHPVLILDEATSSIDTRTEKLVQSGMDALMKGRTVFVIAHRLSTIQNSDVIMVMDHGRIIERGDHEKLIKEKKTYYQLYTGALELE